MANENLKTDKGKDFLTRLRSLADLWLCSDIASQNDSLDALGWTVTLVAIVAAFLILELMQPLYFNQDDDFFQFFPMILTSCRQMFQGHFPVGIRTSFLGHQRREWGYMRSLIPSPISLTRSPPIYCATSIGRSRSSRSCI